MTAGKTATEKGFTLVEMLAVITIMAMVAGALSTSLFAPSEVARLRALASEWRLLDASARLHAECDGPATLSLADGVIVLATQRGVVRRVHPGPNTSVTVVTEAGGTSVVFDRWGQSPDYEVTVASGEWRRAMRVHGLSGLVEEEADGRAP